MEDYYFPRGSSAIASESDGGKSGQKLKKGIDKRKRSGDLFVAISKNKRKKTKKEKKNVSDNDDDVSSNNLVVIEPLTHKTIQVEMVILGSVYHIYEHLIRVALPGVVANLSVSKVSASFNHLAERWAAEQALQQKVPKKKTMRDVPEPEKLVTLDQLFRVGQILKFVVRSVLSNGTPVVSAIPEDVNGGLSVEGLRHGMVLQAAVSSVEDHGYGLEVGVADLAGAFLSRESAPRKLLHIGELLLVRVEKPGQNDRLQFLPYTFKEVISEGDSWNLNNISPGMIVSSTVLQKDEDGIGLWLIKSGLMGAVEPRQVGRKKQVAINDNVPAVVLYKHPVLQILYCSLRVPPVNEEDPFCDFFGLQLGQLIDKAIVIQVKESFVKVEIPLRSRKVSVIGTATRENISDDERKCATELFSVGQVVTCRVIGMALLEGELCVSLRSSVVEGRYYTEADLYIGRVLPARVKSTNILGIVFELAPGVLAFCDFVEASFMVNMNNVAELFPKGKPVLVRIRRINGNHYPPRYFVTCNRQLVFSNRDPISSYETSVVGAVADGVILQVKPRGLLVGFFNKVRGWVPEQYLPDHCQNGLAEKSYQPGQVVTVKVINVNEVAERMTLSLRDAQYESAE